MEAMTNETPVIMPATARRQHGWPSVPEEHWIALAEDVEIDSIRGLGDQEEKDQRSLTSGDELNRSRTQFSRLRGNESGAFASSSAGALAVSICWRTVIAALSLPDRPDLGVLINLDVFRQGIQCFPPELDGHPVLASLAVAGMITGVSLVIASIIFMAVYVIRTPSAAA